MLTRLIADYFAMSAYIKSLCCIPEANTVSYFDYISIKKKRIAPAGGGQCLPGEGVALGTRTLEVPVV